MAKPIETKKYKSSGDFKMTSFINNEDVKTIQPLDTPKKDAITSDGKTLSSVTFRDTPSSFLMKVESSFLRSLKFKKPIMSPNKLRKIKGIKMLLPENNMINPTATGPNTTPNCQPASNLANPDVLLVISVISAILPPAEGLTALPKRPFINLAPTSKIKSNENEIG